MKLHGTWIVRLRGRIGLRDYLKSPAIRVLAILVTFNFQCASLAFFSQRDVGDALQMFRGRAPQFSRIDRIRSKAAVSL